MYVDGFPKRPQPLRLVLPLAKKLYVSGHFFMFEVTSEDSSVRPSVRPSVRLCLIKHLFTLSNPVFQSLALQLDSIQDSYLACQSVLLFILTIHPSAVFRSMHVITHHT